MSRPPDLVQGTLDLLIFKLLAFESLNGWAISQRIKLLSSEVLQVSDGSLYPALHKLELAGFVSAQWRSTENKRRAKFYALTALGRDRMATEATNWDRLSQAITHLVRLHEV
ncbi:MAG: PadR family transcriptional regulator [Gemmatimonadales bacterium]